MILAESCSIEQRLGAELKRREKLDQLRSLELVSGVDFCSNDYLGLAKQSAHNLRQNTSLASGSTGSRLVSGNHPEVMAFEKRMADFHGFGQSLLFDSGYAANLGLLSCLGKKGDLMLLDALAHASLIDGARLSFAKRSRFKHNDLTDLTEQLSKFNANKSARSQQAFVVVEAVYSMDGDAAPLLALAEVCKQFGASLIVDEAHSVGLYGKQGAGLVAHLGLQQAVFAVVYTFGKAAGHHGAVVAGSQRLCDYLVNFCRPFIYTTGPSPTSVKLLDLVYDNLQMADEQRAMLAANLDYFKKKVKSIPIRQAYWLDSDTPIQALILGDVERAKAVARGICDAGLAVKAILSPTVTEGSERLRICLHSNNSFADIDMLAAELMLQVR